MERSKIDAILVDRNLNVKDDSSELDHLASLLLEGSYTKGHGILAPSQLFYRGLPTVRDDNRLHEDTYDPLEGVVREQTNLLHDGEIEQEDEDE